MKLINSLLVIAEITLMFDETRLELAIGDIFSSTFDSFCLYKYWQNFKFYNTNHLSDHSASASHERHLLN